MRHGNGRRPLYSLRSAKAPEAAYCKKARRSKRAFSTTWPCLTQRARVFAAQKHPLGKTGRFCVGWSSVTSLPCLVSLLSPMSCGCEIHGACFPLHSPFGGFKCSKGQQQEPVPRVDLWSSEFGDPRKSKAENDRKANQKCRDCNPLDNPCNQKEAAAMVLCRLVFLFSCLVFTRKTKRHHRGPIPILSNTFFIPPFACQEQCPNPLPSQQKWKFTVPVQTESSQQKEVYHVCWLINFQGSVFCVLWGGGLLLVGSKGKSKKKLPPKKNQNPLQVQESEPGIRSSRSWPPLPWSPRRLCWHSAP